MIRVNENYSRIKPTYLFAEIAARVAAHQKAHPDAKVIRLGIGDVTEPLAPAVIAAMHRAVDDEAARGTFHGYGPEQGYAFLRDRIAEVDFHARGVDVKATAATSRSCSPPTPRSRSATRSTRSTSTPT